MKTLNFLLSFSLTWFKALFFALIIGCSPVVAFFALVILSAITAVAGLPGGSLYDILVEVWTGELVKKFRSIATFLTRIPDRSDLVKNNAVHLVDVGADPEVLINNTTYPIAIAGREDSDISLSLNKFDTENTRITDDELHGLPYDKPGSVIEQHAEVLAEKSADHAIHQLAPADESDTNMPVIETTGASNGETQPRKKLLEADIIRMKKKLDDLKVPKRDRLLVLCNDHVNDLLGASDTFAKLYKDMQEGVIKKFVGFEIHEYPTNPVYSDVGGTLTKKAFGAAAVEATDQNSSVTFYAPRTVQMKGDTTMYYSDARTNPTLRESLVGFRQYHLCIPKKNLGFGAIVSAIYSG